MLMQQVVVQDCFESFIREKRVGVALLAAVIARDSWGIYADGNNSHSTRLELVELFLETPRLGVAEGSPVATVKDQKHPLIGVASQD